jgi:hypothetical protein
MNFAMLLQISQVLPYHKYSRIVESLLGFHLVMSFAMVL